MTNENEGKNNNDEDNRYYVAEFIEIATDDEDENENENEDGDENGEDVEEHLIRAKWCMDGARTLSEASEILESLANSLRQLERDGWQLVEPINDDYGFIRKN
jgi:hypothetical protein